MIMKRGKKKQPYVPLLPVVSEGVLVSGAWGEKINRSIGIPVGPYTYNTYR